MKFGSFWYITHWQSVLCISPLCCIWFHGSPPKTLKMTSKLPLFARFFIKNHLFLQKSAYKGTQITDPPAPQKYMPPCAERTTAFCHGSSAVAVFHTELLFFLSHRNHRNHRNNYSNEKPTTIRMAGRSPFLCFLISVWD